MQEWSPSPSLFMTYSVNRLFHEYRKSRFPFLSKNAKSCHIDKTQIHLDFPRGCSWVAQYNFVLEKVLLCWKMTFCCCLCSGVMWFDPIFWTPLTALGNLVNRQFLRIVKIFIISFIIHLELYSRCKRYTNEKNWVKMSRQSTIYIKLSLVTLRFKTQNIVMVRKFKFELKNLFPLR